MKHLSMAILSTLVTAEHRAVRCGFSQKIPNRTEPNNAPNRTKPNWSQSKPNWKRTEFCGPISVRFCGLGLRSNYFGLQFLSEYPSQNCPKKINSATVIFCHLIWPKLHWSHKLSKKVSRNIYPRWQLRWRHSLRNQIPHHNIKDNTIMRH